ncbi:MAG: hypothetical protein L3J59_16405, partial [Methylococcaceae bacterium]|nr:hypothetical protein [Methylococcaceae bacterium]
MKNFTKTLVAATLALGTVSANASILRDNSGAAEAWLSVYDSTSANTFTLDLGVAGITWDSLFAQKDSAGLLQNVNLAGFSDWTAFKASADLTTTKFSVAVGGELAGSKKAFMVTGDDAGFFQGKDAPAIAGVTSAINIHAAGINDDTATPFSPLVNSTTLVNDADATLGIHGASADLWYSASFNVDTAYGEMADFNLVTLITANRRTSSVHDVFAGQWKLEGDSLTLGVSAVPVPAAVWMFGSALLGLAGVSRK